MRSARTYPVAVEQAFDTVLALPLDELFTRRYGPIPPIRSVEGQQGAWGTVGQSRVIRLADGGSMREELTSLERPRSFAYRISEVTGAMKPIAARVDGLWSFEPAGTGVQICWQWTVHPASKIGAVALPVFARFWRGYARQALEQLEATLVAA